MNGSAKMGTTELYHLEEKVFNKGTASYYYTTYEIMLTLLDRNAYHSLWKKCYEGWEESLALLTRVGVKITVYNGSRKWEYKIRDFYKGDNYNNYLEASKDLNAIRIEGDQLEKHRCIKERKFFRSLYSADLGEKIYEDIMNFIRDRINDTFKVDFEITESRYDDIHHIEYITAKLKDYIFTVDFHFKSADIDLDGQYLGNKIANVGFKCFKESYSRCIKDFLISKYNYEKSLEVLKEYLKEITYLSDEVVGTKLIAALNQRVYVDTQVYLRDHSHLTKYMYKDWSKGANETDTKVEIIANWKTDKLDSLIKDYNESFNKKMPLGDYLRLCGIVSELSVVVEKDNLPIVNLLIKNDNDPQMLKVLDSIQFTKPYYKTFKLNLSTYLSNTFADRVIKLPSKISEVLDDLKATSYQKKVIADAIEKVECPYKKDEGDYFPTGSDPCEDVGPGGWSPVD